MTQSDLDMLLEMGFEKSRAELAVKKSGGLQGALEWLEANQDKSIEELQEAAAEDAAAEEAGAPSIASVAEGETANSLVCNECGKKFRNPDSASFHAAKSGHTDFSESTEAIAHLTEEQKKERLAELRELVKAKKAMAAETDKEDTKRNEKIRQKATKETQDLMEELKRKEQIREAQLKRKEKLDDLEAKKRIKAKIEADKAERKRKADEAKAIRDGTALPSETTTPTTSAPGLSSPSSSSAPKPASSSVNNTQARLRLQTSGGNIQKTLPAETTLAELATSLQDGGEVQGTVISFSLTFPRKVFREGDFGQTLAEAGVVPSGVLIVETA